MRRLRIIGVILALAIAATLVGVALGSRTGHAAKPHRAKPPAATGMHRPTGARHTARVKVSNAPRVTSTGKEDNPGENTPADPDNVQQGDQSSPDVGGQNESEPNGENESNVESEQGQPGEPAVGHEDPPGQDVNHECTGDCRE